jgi:hypothetical protein
MPQHRLCTSITRPGPCSEDSDGLPHFVSLSTIIEAAIGNTAWQRNDSIITRVAADGTSRADLTTDSADKYTMKGRYEGDISLVQGLGVAYSRNVTTPTLRAYIEAYLTVQVRRQGG